MANTQEHAGYRAIPSVSAVLDKLAPLAATLRHDLATDVVGASLANARRRIAAGELLTREEIIADARADLVVQQSPRLRRVLNGTGIVIHTNLGRAPVSAETARAMAEVAASAVPLEIEPETNERGGRMDEISGLLRLLTGAEAALVVNNNAAAVLLVLAALAHGREVIVSRGEAVEIGGGFRIPDVLLQSGARLVEVGTTNRTYVRDYKRAIGPETAALLKVHPSNFRMSGFTVSPPIEELTALGDAHGIPVLEDLGSGALLDSSQFGLTHEPTIGERLAAGVAVVTASGDKLLGGPQAGIIAGRKDLVSVVASHPLARAVRADKTALAGLAVTLRHYLRGEAVTCVPIWRMISAQPDALRRRAEAIIAAVSAGPLSLDLVDTVASVGGGSLPGQEMSSIGIRVTAPEVSKSADDLARTVRTHEPVALFSRIHDGAVVVDLRAILPEDDQTLVEILEEVGANI